MSTTEVSDFIVQRLAEWGVACIFGYSGDGINGILGALGRGSENQTPGSKRWHLVVSTNSTSTWPGAWIRQGSGRSNVRPAPRHDWPGTGSQSGRSATRVALVGTAAQRLIREARH